MKRDFLKSLNIENDVIDKIMAQYGADVELLKASNLSQVKEIQALENDIKQRDEQLEKLKNSTANIDDLKAQIETLQNENKTNNEKYQNELKQIKINNAVEKALTSANARNKKVIIPLLSEFLSKANLDEQGMVIGLSEQIQKLVESDDTKFLFGTSQSTLKGVAPAQKSDTQTGFIDQAAFDANKNNPDWINKNWDTISVALKEGTIKG